MPKANRSNLKIRPTIHGLISHGVRDLEAFLPTERRLKLLQLIESGTEEELTSFISDSLVQAVSHRTSYQTYAAWRQLESLFSKNTDLTGTSANSRKDAAIEKFLASEEKCRRTNKRLSYYRNHPSRLSLDISEIVELARNITKDICGELSHLNHVKMIDQAGFGPGFTFGSTEGDHRNLYYKAYGPHTVTPDALPDIKFTLHYWSTWKRDLIEQGCTYDLVRGNRITTVPKTAVIDRTIAIEPSLNVFLQKGVDHYLKRRLRRHGVTLRNQERSHGQARLGSMRPFHTATIDLSQASDCVTIEVMKLLFPKEWYELLDCLRSPEFTLDKGNTWTRYEKFSSMGNAFTFPIESIIFFALAKACTIFAGGRLKRLRVYGDDIVIDSRASLILVETLKHLGFETNREKSFFIGNFRETCGADFLSGVDLRPVYVRSCPRNDQEAYNLFNRLVRNRVGFRMHNLCAYLHGCVEKPLYGPSSLPAGKENYRRWIEGKSVIFDHYFHSPSSAVERHRRFYPDLQRYGWFIQRLRFVPTKVNASNYNLQFRYLAFLLGAPGRGIDSVSSFRRKVEYKMILYWPPMPWEPNLYDSV